MIAYEPVLRLPRIVLDALSILFVKLFANKSLRRLSMLLACLHTMSGCDHSDIEIESKQSPLSVEQIPNHQNETFASRRANEHLISHSDAVFQGTDSNVELNTSIERSVTQAESDSRTVRRSTRRPTSSTLPPMLEVRTRSLAIAGLPIGVFSDKTLLMLRDGGIHELENVHIQTQQITNEPFRSIEPRELSNQLQSEFGNNYRVRNASVYLVVAKPETLNQWCDRFRSFQHSLELYCSTRGLSLRRPDFPLVAVVFGSQREFTHYAQSERAMLPANCVGYYSQRSNRIVLFDSENSQASNETLETICHEATHQFAFNSGLHQRLAATPLWVAEGFAVQFESPSLCNLAARDHSTLWPGSQREAWGRLVREPAKIRNLMDRLVRCDTPFKTDTLDAYTVSWAMSSYLSNRMGREYSSYLQKVSSLAPFTDYPPSDRMRDFSSHFGTDLGILSKSIRNYLDTLQ